MPLSVKPAPALLKEEMVRRGFLAAPPVKPLSEAQKAEIARCAADPVYFISRYIWTYDPFLRYETPYVLLKLFPFQVEFVRWIEERMRTMTDGVVEKSRESGASCIVLAYFLYRWRFTEAFSAGVGSNKLESVDNLGDPKSLFEKLRLMLKRLPEWLLPPDFSIKRNCGECKIINPSNGSTIIGEGGDQIGRGGRASVYLIDEAAYLEHPDLVDASLFQTTRVRLYVSTPFGRNAFHRKKSRLPVFKMYWKEDPRKNHWEAVDQNGTVALTGNGYAKEVDRTLGLTVRWPWFEKEAGRENPNVVAQEIEINYLGSGNPVFDNAYLSTVYEELIALKFEHRLRFEEEATTEWGGDLSTFKDPVPGGHYIITADVAEGLTKDAEHDWSVAHVYDLTTWEQVAHYRGRPDTHIYAEDIANLAYTYNNALVAVERNGPGLSVLNVLMNVCNYANIYYHQDFDDMGGALTSLKPGWPATRRTRKESINELDAIIRDMAKDELGFVWNEPNTIDEIMSFVKRPGFETGADTGAYDDEVTCCRIAALLVPMYSRRRSLPAHRQEFRPMVSGTSYISRK